MVIISLILGIILRVYQIGTNYYFTGELGKELLYAGQFIQSGTIPMVGMSTSHEWLNYGPVYYWILIPLIKIFGNSPYILFWLSLAVSTIGILITYLVFRKIVNKRFAGVLSFFISLSPLWIWATRLSKLHTFFFILTPVVIYFLYKIWNKEKKYIFWLGIVFGLLFSFHFSQIPILVVIILAFWLKRKFLKLADYLKFVLGMIIPNITILIYDALHGFKMIRDLTLWIPYRIVVFKGGGNTLSAFNDFFGKNLFWDSKLWILGSFIFVILFVTFVVQNYKKVKKDFLTFYLISSTMLQGSALLIHTNPPLHYFFPIFLNFGILFSFYTCQFWKKKATKIFTILIFVLMFVAGILGLKNEHANDPDYIPLKNQLNAIDFIIKDADGQSINLSRVGLYDYFPEQYSQNYQFLILSNEGKLDKTLKYSYTIYEVGQNVYVGKNAEN